MHHLLFFCLLCASTTAELLSILPLNSAALSYAASQARPYESQSKVDTQQSASSVVCITAQHKYCQSLFNDGIGIDPALDWNNADQIVAAVEQLLDYNLTDVLTVCQSRAMFYQCLGNQYLSCVSLYNLMGEVGQNISEAYMYVQLYQSLGFMCNDGFEEVINQYSCLRNVPEASNQYQECVDDFNNNVGRDPNNLCQYVGQTSQCMNSAFAVSCATTDPQGAGWYGCEVFKTSFDASCYASPFRCYVHDVPPPPVSPAP